MVIDRTRAGNVGDVMQCDASTRATRERGMDKLAEQQRCVGYTVKRKLKDDFTLASVSRALGIGEVPAWSLMLANRPTNMTEQRRLEDSAGLEHGTLDKWL